MKDLGTKKPLFRKVNTKARGGAHAHGGDYRDTRSREPRGKMGGKRRRGLDYTPLFRFLLSKVGQKWDDVFSEASARLDRVEPIFWVVALDIDQGKETVRVGESTYFSELWVDKEGSLRKVEPSLNESSFPPSCRFCTHTFNGIQYTQRYEE